MKLFVDVLEDAKELNLLDKQELIVILDQIVAEERRNEIYENYQKSLSNTNRAFSSNVDDLRKRLSL